MTNSHKLKAVVRHEFLTIVRQPSFWISLFALPLIIGLVLLIGYLTDSPDSQDIAKDKTLTISVIDRSGIIDQEVIGTYGAQLKSSQDEATLTAQVKAGELDGLIIYPADLASSGNYTIRADNSERDNASAASEIGRTMLQQSLLTPLDDQRAALALSGGESTVQSYTNGKPSRQIFEQIVPGIFLVLFYLILVFSVGYALTSIAEEKENRSIEMVLSYVRPQTLILGKLLAIIMVTLFQLAIIASITVIAFFIAKSLGNTISLPFSVDDLTFVPFEILIGISFLVTGFIFYVALMAMIGAIFPSSKEASGFSTVFFILPAVPFWGIDAITNKPDSLFTQILTYFPLTSPTTTLFRNMAGNLSVAEGIVALVILILATFVAIYLASKAFRLGTLEYTNRIKFSSLLKR